MIAVTQNQDGTLELTGATSITATQTATGMRVSANDTIASLPVDNSAALQAKIDKAKADLS